MANPLPGTVIPVGSLVSPGGLQGVAGPVGGIGPVGPSGTPAPAWTVYNSIRNPEMLVGQRGGSGTTTGVYTLDGWITGLVGSGIAISWSQILVDIPADQSGNRWYPHIQYAYRVTFTTGKATLAAADAVVLYQHIEGNLAAALKDNPSSISLLVRATIPGTFTVALRDAANPNSQSYVTPGTIVSGNTWTRIPLPNIPAFPAAGTFPSGTGNCYDLLICPVMGVGNANSAPTLSQWIAGNYWGSGTSTNFAATTNNTFDFTIVQHEPNPICNPYVQRSLEREWKLSLRYLCYPMGGIYFGWNHDAQWTYDMGKVTFPVPMRVAPALTAGATFSGSGTVYGTPGITAASVNSCNINNSANNWPAGNWFIYNGGFTAEL